MKQILFLVTLLISLTGRTQDYIPILQEGNKWSVDTHYCPFDPGNPPMNWIISRQHTLDPDPVEINGVLYTQILLEDEPSCLLREDNGQVYKYIPSINEEKILFDFDAEIGDEYPYIGSALVYDSCNGVNSNVGIFFLEVMDIRIEFIAGENRKVIVLTDLYWPGSEDLFWIEGIGTRAGLGNSWQAWDVTCGSGIACFENNGVTYFMNGATSCDNTTLGVSDIPARSAGGSEEKVILYPNPVVHKSILQLPHEGYADTIRIFNLHGKLVKEVTLSTDHFMIDAMQYRAGRYFVRIIANNNTKAFNSFIVR